MKPTQVALAAARKELGIVCEHLLHGHRAQPCAGPKDLMLALEALIDAKLAAAADRSWDCGTALSEEAGQ